MVEENVTHVERSREGAAFSVWPAVTLKPVGHLTIDRIVRGGDFDICLEHGAVSCVECKGLGSNAYQKVSIPIRFTPEVHDSIIVIESGTQLSASITNTILKGKEATYQETLHDYRNNGNYLNRILGYVQNSKYNCIITAHVTEAEQEDKSIKLCPSIGTRNYAINVNKFFDHVVYCHKQNAKHKAASSTTYANNIQAGSRLDVAIEKDTEASLVELFRGGRVGEVVQPKAQAILGEVSKLATNIQIGGR